MAIGADERVWQSHFQPPFSRRRIISQKDTTSQKLQIDLMHDPDCRRYNPEIFKRLLAPTQKGVAFGIAGKLHLDIFFEGIRCAEKIDLYRVVDNQIDWHEWIDFSRIPTEAFHRRPHGRKIDNTRHAGKILQHDSGRLERDFRFGWLGGIPCSKAADVGFCDFVAVTGAQQRFQHDSNRIGESRCVGHSGIVKGPQSIKGGGASPSFKLGAGGKRIDERSGHREDVSQDSMKFSLAGALG